MCSTPSVRGSPAICLWNSSSVRLTDNGLSRRIVWRFLFPRSVLQAIDGSRLITLVYRNPGTASQGAKVNKSFETREQGMGMVVPQRFYASEERETDRQTDRNRERQIETERQRWRDRQTDRQTETQRETQREREENKSFETLEMGMLVPQRFYASGQRERGAGGRGFGERERERVNQWLMTSSEHVRWPTDPVVIPEIMTPRGSEKVEPVS